MVLREFMGEIFRWRDEGERARLLKTVEPGVPGLVFTNGCFDILHVGHAKTLEWAKGRGECLVVGLNSDSSVRDLKGMGRPVVMERERAEMLLALRAVDHVVIFDGATPEEVVKALRPDVLVKGEDWKGKKVAGEEFAGRIEFAPLVPCVSTTLKVSDCERAWRLNNTPKHTLGEKLFVIPIVRIARFFGFGHGREW